MGTSVAAATDYLLATIATATGSITAPNGQPVLVVDGYPLTRAQCSVVVGLDAPPDLASTGPAGTRAWVGTGQPGRTQEDYTIPVYIDVWQGGTNMQAVRNLAVSIFDAIWAALKADLTLGGALSGELPAEVDEVRWIPTDSGDQAAQGRRMLCQFGVRCRNRYIT